MSGLLNIDPFNMPVTSGLLAAQNNNNFTAAGMSQDPLASGIGQTIKNNPSALLALGAGLLQAGQAGQSTGAGVGYGLAAFSQALAQAEQQKQQNRLAQLKAMELETKLRRQMMGAFEGTGMSAQVANMQAQRYIQQGLSPQEAFYRAGRDVMQSVPVTTQDPATGALVTMQRNPIPFVGGGAGVVETPLVEPGQTVQPPINPAMRPSNDFERNLMNPVPPQMGEASFLDIIAPQSGEISTTLAATNQNLTPIEQRTKSIKETEQAVDRMKLLNEEASAASGVVSQAEQALNVLNSGFPGGARSELLAQYYNLVGKNNPTPEEQKFLQDYAVLERYSGNQTLQAAQALKPLSNSDLDFARNMSGKPSQNPDILRTKIMLDYAINTRKTQKAELASQWEAQYGSLAKRDPSGASFDDFVKQNLGGPLITPDLAARFGGMFYVNGIDELEAMNMPPGTKAFDLKTKKMLVVE